MTNLLAMLLSLALLFTGTPGGAPGEMTARTMSIGNIEIVYGDETISLAPTLTLGVQTDGETVAFDGFVDREGERLLPVQLASDGEQLLLAIGDDVYAVPPALLGLDPEEGAEDAGASLQLAARYLDVYRQLLQMMGDPEHLAAFQAQADQIYDELVDRGAGTPERLVYDGENYDVTSYEYDLTGEQIAALIEAVYAQNEVLSAYAETYFALLASLPEEAGMSGVDSWTALLARTPMQMHIVESLSTNGLRIQDVAMTASAPEMAMPMTCNIHSARLGDRENSNVTGQIDSNGMSLEIYLEHERNGAAYQGSLTISGDPSADAEATGEQAEDGEAAEDEENEEEYEDEGETDSEDALYLTVDYSSEPEDLSNLEISCDLAGGARYTFSIDTQLDEDAGMASYVTIGNTVNDQEYELSFDISYSDAPFELRAVADGDEPPEALDMLAAAQRLGADVETLTSDEAIAQAALLFQALGNVGGGGDIAESGDDLPFANPVFDYLPDGYAQSDIIVDRDNRYVSLTFANSAAGANLYVSLGDALSGSRVTRYVADPDGKFAPLEGMLVTREDYGDYVMYSAERNGVSYSVFPDGGDLSPEEVVKLLAGIRFE